VVLVPFCAGAGVVVHVMFVILVSLCAEQYSCLVSSLIFAPGQPGIALGFSSN